MTRVATTAAVLMVLGAACGGGNSAPGGIDRLKQVSAATTAEKGAICDWFAPMTGGYGVMAACVYLPTWPDRATCVATFPSCSATIGQFQDCLVDLLPLLPGCTQAKIDDARLKPECMAAAPCFMMLLDAGT